MRKIARRAVVALLGAVAVGAPAAAARELRVGLAAEPGALDPHFQNIPADVQIAAHMFEALVARDEALNLAPALAVSWRAVDDTTWEFKLRAGVRFHDGSDLTAADVVFSLARAARVPNSAAPFAPLLRQVAGVDAVDDATIRIRTSVPLPTLPANLAAIRVVSRQAASGPAPEGRTTDELNRGEGLVGTGPFRFGAWTRGKELSLTRHDAYWGAAPAWTRVDFHVLPNATTRVAALESGDVDIIEAPTAADLPRLSGDQRLALARAPSTRTVHIHLDHFAEPTPGIPDAGGRNPLKDRRVREALSLAIDRDALVADALGGIGWAAGDFLPFPMFGARRGAAPAKSDPARARALLAEAGYPAGFSLTLGAPNGAFAQDTRVAAAVAARWSAVGIKTQVEASAPSAFLKNRDDHRYSAYLAVRNTASGDMGDALRALVATPSPERGAGDNNRGRYSNPAVDAALAEALRAVDPDRRRAALEEASRLAIADFAVLPLYFEPRLWAMKRGLTYAARADGLTFAWRV
ncbi:MAG: ABC transporter substrate-binding protein, partial [Rhodospirillales bacterium]|nr:ABC transporter substrate-binding protein [Rhodospirillales bacterium]